MIDHRRDVESESEMYKKVSVPVHQITSRLAACRRTRPTSAPTAKPAAADRVQEVLHRDFGNVRRGQLPVRPVGSAQDFANLRSAMVIHRSHDRGAIG